MERLATAIGNQCNANGYSVSFFKNQFGSSVVYVYRNINMQIQEIQVEKENAKDITPPVQDISKSNAHIEVDHPRENRCTSIITRIHDKWCFSLHSPSSPMA